MSTKGGETQHNSHRLPLDAVLSVGSRTGLLKHKLLKLPHEIQLLINNGPNFKFIPDKNADDIDYKLDLLQWYYKETLANPELASTRIQNMPLDVYELQGEYVPVRYYVYDLPSKVQPWKVGAAKESNMGVLFIKNPTNMHPHRYRLLVVSPEVFNQYKENERRNNVNDDIIYIIAALASIITLTRRSK